jgi:hypothetical protein
LVTASTVVLRAARILACFQNRHQHQLAASYVRVAIFELNADRKWWQGRALDPCLVFKEKG